VGNYRGVFGRRLTLAAVFTAMLLQDEGTKHLNSAKTNTIPQQKKGRLAFPYQSAQHRGYPAKRIRLPFRTKARWNNPVPKGGAACHRPILPIRLTKSSLAARPPNALAFTL
jgi:hypothetical protein